MDFLQIQPSVNVTNSGSELGRAEVVSALKLCGGHLTSHAIETLRKQYGTILRLISPFDAEVVWQIKIGFFEFVNHKWKLIVRSRLKTKIFKFQAKPYGSWFVDGVTERKRKAICETIGEFDIVGIAECKYESVPQPDTWFLLLGSHQIGIIDDDVCILRVFQSVESLLQGLIISEIELPD